MTLLIRYIILLCSYNNIMVNGWVEACANGRVGGRGGLIDVYRNGNVV